MIKQISLIAIIAVGIGALFLGMNVPASATVPPGCTGDPHIGGAAGDPHNGFAGTATGNPHISFGTCPGAK